MKILSSALRSTKAAVDLSSIMVGVIVIGILGGVIAAAVFAVIPWAQNQAAAQIATSINTAQSAYYGLSEENSYGDKADLQNLEKNETTTSLIQDSSQYDVKAGKNGSENCWGAVIRSNSGAYFYSHNQKAQAQATETFATAQQNVSAHCNVTLVNPTPIPVADQCIDATVTTNIFATVADQEEVNCNLPTSVFVNEAYAGQTSVGVTEDSAGYTITTLTTPEGSWGETANTEPLVSCVYWAENYDAADPTTAAAYVTDLPYYPYHTEVMTCAKETVSPFNPIPVSLQAVVLKTGNVDEIRTVWTKN